MSQNYGGANESPIMPKITRLLNRKYSSCCFFFDSSNCCGVFVFETSEWWSSWVSAPVELRCGGTFPTFWNPRKNPLRPIWVFEKNMGKPPNHPIVHRVFHYFHHPFWGFSPYFWKHPSIQGIVSDCQMSRLESFEPPNDLLQSMEEVIWQGDGFRRTVLWERKLQSTL